MSEMIERVAKAIKAEMGRQMEAKPLLGDTSSDDWTATGDVATIDLSELARAAIEAMREPTEAMINKDEDAWDEAGRGAAKHLWQMMIDAALSAEAKKER